MKILSSISIQKLNFEVNLWDLQKLLLNKMHRTAAVSTRVDFLSPLQNHSHRHLFKQNHLAFLYLSIFSKLLYGYMEEVSLYDNGVFEKQI